MPWDKTVESSKMARRGNPAILVAGGATVRHAFLVRERHSHLAPSRYRRLSRASEVPQAEAGN